MVQAPTYKFIKKNIEYSFDCHTVSDPMVSTFRTRLQPDKPGVVSVETSWCNGESVSAVMSRGVTLSISVFSAVSGSTDNITSIANTRSPLWGLTMTDTNHKDQTHNLVKFVQRCCEFGDFLKVRR